MSRGHSFVWDQQWEEAVREFNIAIQEMPKEPAPYAGLGDAYLELTQLDKALDSYKLAARYSGGNIIYLRKVADMQERLNLMEEAGKTYMAIGEMELSRRHLNEAMDNWHRAVRLEPNLLRAHQRLASVYKRQGAVRSAIREYLAIARILQMQGERDKALQACQLALQLDPRNADVLTAIEMVKQGKRLFEGEQNAATAEMTGMGEAVQRLTSALEDREWQGKKQVETAAPVQVARDTAMKELANRLFSDDADVDMGDALLIQALDYQRRNMTNEAISAYEQAINAGVSTPAAHFNLGLLYQDKLRFEDAIREFQISLNDQDYRLASHFSLGECHRARGRIEKALQHFITVLQIVDVATVQRGQADRLIQLYENLYETLTAHGERDQATAFANSLVDFLGQKGWEDKAKEARTRLNAISSAGMMILGDVLTAGSEQVLESLFLSQEYARRSLYNTAIEETYRAIQLAPDYMSAHIQLGDILIQQGRREAAAVKYSTIAKAYLARDDVNGAITAYEKVVELDPLDVSVRGRLINLLKQYNLAERALEHYQVMGETFYQLAQVDRARQTYQDALNLAEQAKIKGNWRTRFLRLIAEIDMQRFNWKQALTAYRELRDLEPGDERTAITLVDLYYKVGQPNNAVRALDQYLVQLVRSGRGAKVIGILEDMIRQRPSDANLVDRLVRLYLQQKRTHDAVTVLDKLGEAQLDVGDTTGAIATIEKILELKPANATSYQQLLAQLRQAS
ncbi:MAG: tetratricopeptide repeat protein [Anaerolineales bacterium]|nr:tetratricopeptide repeat protein [Anaerolineales bacterium]